jgi:hypothetical protein
MIAVDHMAVARAKVIDRMAAAICTAGGRSWRNAPKPRKDRYREMARAAALALSPTPADFDEDIAIAVATSSTADVRDHVSCIGTVEHWIDEVLR